MLKQKRKKISWLKRRNRVRKKVFGTQDRPRLNVYRGLKNIHVQLIDDVNNKTILSASTVNPEVKSKLKSGGNIKAAVLLGGVIAKEAKAKGIEKVAFDRSGYAYRGRVKALAEAARKGGLSF